MGKKKTKSVLTETLYEFDRELDQKYVGLLEEIQFMQADIRRAERKARRKAKKKLKKGSGFYDPRAEINIRKQVIYEMEGTDFFTRVTEAINALRPICIIIAKLVMTLIVSILSIDAVKYRIKEETLGKLHSVYSLAKRVSVA